MTTNPLTERVTAVTYSITLWKKRKGSGSPFVVDPADEVVAKRTTDHREKVMQDIWNCCTNVWQEVDYSYYVTVIGGEYVTAIFLFKWVELRYLDFRRYFLEYARYPQLGVKRSIPQFGVFIKQLKGGE